jgi:hypothetical protein
VKRKILAVLVCLSIVPSGAYAVDWSLNSTLTETVEANDNPFLRALAAGAFNSYSTIAANAVARTPTSKFSFDGDVNYRKYWGPGADGTPSESLGGNARLHYETYGKDSSDRNYIDAGWHRQSTAFALLGELGVVTNTRGFVDTTNVAAGIDRSITNLDTISLSARSAYTSYDPGVGGTTFVDSGATGTWRHRVNSIAAISASSDVEVLSFNNSLNTNITILKENAGIDATLSPRLLFNGTVGVAYVQTDHGSPVFSLTPLAANASSSGSIADFIANMALTYRMFPDTTLSFIAGQSISPSVVGSLIKSTTIGAGLAYTVNSRETLSFAANGSRTTSLGTTSDFLSASMTYSYLLTREWTAQLSYRYLHRLATSGTASSGFVIDPVTGIPTPTASGLAAATSNSIMLVVSRSVSILPDGY